MKLEPRIEALGECDWKVSGIKLHMEGRWELSMIFRLADGKEISLKKGLTVIAQTPPVSGIPVPEANKTFSGG